MGPRVVARPLLTMKLKNGKLVLTEAQITRQCIDYLKAEGWTCQRNHVGTFIPASLVWGLIGQTREWVKRALGKNTIRIGTAGDPDWLIFHRYRGVFWLELKTLRGKLFPVQRLRVDTLRCDGHLVCVCRGLDDLREWMRGNL